MLCCMNHVDEHAYTQLHLFSSKGLIFNIFIIFPIYVISLALDGSSCTFSLPYSHIYYCICMFIVLELCDIQEKRILLIK
ncbi:hypothetical protein N665_0611s0035 [Sinapis alba]|nr:hypothetical protein N665_0611s0035 [Sinapis alba]